MKLKTLFLLCLLAILPYSCRKEIKSEKGGIDLISNVYFDASKGLEQMQSFHLSKLNYLGNQIIEFVPDHSFPEINMQTYFMQDSLFYPVENDNESIILSEVAKTQKPQLVWNKKEGAIFSKEQILNYRNRRKLSDTVLFNKKYKRFEINSPWNYTRFYIYPTDTILPYSIYRHAEKDYGGRLERIDSYNKKTDIFVSLQLLPRKNWDYAAKEIFDFNHFVNSRKSE
ncbi:hypothetical protein H0S70_01825 [Chryseobacterium manosquense]|jgi:hypothetical protein|uniref:Uncharacterized protein n=1 Tax=Chryseobacterium manosquense TaxID=2754694 RepID=A0A7H1DXQ0_9FLAO|nr:hypothetical protein [Chryseobacterium manosquense]QIY83747.1 hypothetical protein HER18_09500 [Chryseobacterium sp. NEB161]QNS41758.1 hypothetical protein H0S70_01825 [Chryseobacterium manosquense]